jgi:hypothetical protein
MLVARIAPPKLQPCIGSACYSVWLRYACPGCPSKMLAISSWIAAAAGKQLDELGADLGVLFIVVVTEDFMFFVDTNGSTSWAPLGRGDFVMCSPTALISHVASRSPVSVSLLSGLACMHTRRATCSASC